MLIFLFRLFCYNLTHVPGHNNFFSTFFSGFSKFKFKRNFGEKKTLSFIPYNFSEEF